MRTLFVGGPGRSGTSFVADRLGRHPEVCTFPDIELKLFTEKNGLIDLHHALVETYSPNRATVALDQFQRLAFALVDGRHGQPALTTFAPRIVWSDMIDAFAATLSPQGHAGPMRSESFHLAARHLLWQIAQIAASLDPGEAPPCLFLEKTPHALLAPDFLARLSPGCGFLHVMRDPRSVAYSLQSVGWGPTDLTACCQWVANYCEAWLTTQAKAAHLGLRITGIHIEAVAHTPTQHSQHVCRDFDLIKQNELFRNADLETLNGWVAKCSKAKMAELNDQLSGWSDHFGYLGDRIGIMKSFQPDYAA